ncbi:DUF4199 domain-containing protein [Aequorivita antarctica]|uniref:DUF4199 domain-containing protein n=1 Tax=Aequorivita antarctica TaxID=153266 RepID=A0A5C6Z152_9FLAO|nr:DUF4199 domain-containing protein [Aequorivita antarctica]TXD73415.1 DUF4199 domain-containing protein [Aequorivita antarctica]SRX76295.1 hypothetical protein AEQU3_03295 [Aequorivita antarctica]
METQTASLKKIALNYGVLLALLSIALQVISYVLDVHIDRPWWLTVLQLLISVTAIVYGIKAFKTINAGFLTLSQSLKVGLAISLVAGIIAVIFNYIFMNFIDPDFIQKTLDFSREQMIENYPNMSQEQIENSLEISAKFMTPWIMSAFAIIATLFFGFIISLIAGLIMKKNPPQQI